MREVFISIPMQGRSAEEVRCEFNEVASRYLAEGDEAIQTILEPPLCYTGNQRIFMLGRSIQLLAKADLALIPSDYRFHSGCQIEIDVCREYGIPYLIYERMEGRYIADE